MDHDDYRRRRCPQAMTTDATSTVTFEVDHNFLGTTEFYSDRYFQPVSGTATIRGDNIQTRIRQHSQTTALPNG